DSSREPKPPAFDSSGGEPVAPVVDAVDQLEPLGGGTVLLKRLPGDECAHRAFADPAAGRRIVDPIPQARGHRRALCWRAAGRHRRPGLVGRGRDGSPAAFPARASVDGAGPPEGPPGSLNPSPTRGAARPISGGGSAAAPASGPRGGVWAGPTGAPAE